VPIWLRLLARMRRRKRLGIARAYFRAEERGSCRRKLANCKGPGGLSYRSLRNKKR
jgi:hypothetical protein